MHHLLRQAGQQHIVRKPLQRKGVDSHGDALRRELVRDRHALSRQRVQQRLVAVLQARVRPVDVGDGLRREGAQARRRPLARRLQQPVRAVLQPAVRPQDVGQLLLRKQPHLGHALRRQLVQQVALGAEVQLGKAPQHARQLLRAELLRHGGARARGGGQQRGVGVAREGKGPQRHGQPLRGQAPHAAVRPLLHRLQHAVRLEAQLVEGDQDVQHVLQRKVLDVVHHMS
mmetsp:Transcript_9443/g.24072  ORF Transcript_9443/g.24072 Transcript_9443/m.24072 type:complete len:229 (-) Transcript_9443:68-754(-)